MSEFFDLAHDQHIAGKSPLAIAGSKIALNYARDHSTADSLQQMAVLQSAIIDSAKMSAPGATRCRPTSRRCQRPPRCSPMQRVLRSLLLCAGLFACSVVSAGDRPASCSAAEHHQFDFWIGHWDVYLPNGNKAGENRVEAIEGGCALLEQWTGTRGPTGKSLNIYDTLRRLWHQTWVDSTGGLLVLEGHWTEGRMVLSSSANPIQRITWAPQSDGSVRQLWESSKDGGKTWSTAFDGKYIKKK